MTLIAGASLVSGSPGAAYRLDETAGVLAVIGEGRAPARAQHPAQARLMAERAAVVDAYGTAARLLSEALDQTGAAQEAPSLSPRGGRITSSETAPDGSVKVEVEFPLSPELAARVRDVIRRPSQASGQGEPAPGLSHAEFMARHGIPGPRPITLTQWLDRYRRESRIPEKQ